MDQVAFCIGKDLALASLDFLACIIILETASFRGFTLWLSTTPALGEASRLCASRTNMSTP